VNRDFPVTSTFLHHSGCVVAIFTFHLRAFIFFERSKETKQKKIAGKHPRLPTIGLIATTKESFGLFALYSCGLRAFKFIHFWSFQAAFVATAICAKWVPVSARLLRQLADTVDKDVNAGKRRDDSTIILQ